ncbi:MAG TPA: helix-hairpin-helix domain-containing protein [Gaiellaceae bacterium]|jgi:competence protein ComEA|nr:helix-hairpin-helix domain-containing protein [Gaiellaceae bacterium]
MATFPLGVHGRRVLAAAILALVLVVVAWRHAAAGSPAPLRVAPIAPARASPAVTARLLVVDVVGAVHRPGLVRLREGSRVADAIAHAGGLARGAERGGVNFAAPVSDGQQVLVPQRGAVAVGAGADSGAAAPAGGPVSLSSATAAQLDALPGVGPVTAEKIVAYRQQHGAFRSVDELDAISGIGPSRIADLRGLVVP